MSPETRSLGMSWAKASAISLLPMLAMHCRAKVMKMGFLEDKSFFMFWMINLIRSLSWFRITEMKR